MWRDFTLLPPEAQQRVADFTSALKACYATRTSKRTQKRNLIVEQFIGTWHVREDMNDRSAWVRDLRARES